MAVVIETGFLGDAVDLNHPRIGYERLGGTVTTDSEASGFAAANAATPRTDSAWMAETATAFWRSVFDSPQVVGYVGVAVHNLGAVGATVTLQYFDGASWLDWPNVAPLSPSDDLAVMFLVTPTAVEGVGLSVSNGPARIGVIAAGDVMEWPRMAEWVGQPITEGEQNRYNVNRSDTGNWLGRTRIASGLGFRFEVNNLSESFRYGPFKEFKDYANTGAATFFIAPRPLDYPLEVAYAWSPETVMMTREVPNKVISGKVNLQLMGYRSPL